MMKRKMIFLLAIFLLSLVSSSPYSFNINSQNPYSSNTNHISTLKGQSDVNINNPTNTEILIYNSTLELWENGYLNDSAHSVNNSQFLRGLTPQEVADLYVETDPIFSSWLSNPILENDLDMDGNDINNVGNITASYFLGNGSQLTGVPWNRSGTDVYLANTGDNVGIGTASPDTILDIGQQADNDGIKISGFDDKNTDWLKLNLDASGFSAIDAKQGFRFRKNGNNIAFIDDSDSNGFRMYNDIALSFGTSFLTRYMMGYDSTSGNFRLAYGGGFTNDANVKLIITPTGNVGIGTTTPQNKLDVSGGQVIGSSYAGVNTAPTDGLLVEGNVGIGTASPDTILDIGQKADDEGIIVRGFDDKVTSWFSMAINAGGIPVFIGTESFFFSPGISMSGNSELRFGGANPNVKMRYDTVEDLFEMEHTNSVGAIFPIIDVPLNSDTLSIWKDVGINTATPLSTLHIDGGVGSLSTGLTFGDGDTGFYENFDDNLLVSIGGTATYVMNNAGIGSAASGGSRIMNRIATSTAPGITPSNMDSNTGIGWADTDQLSLIAGGVEMLRLDETNDQSFFPTGNVGIGTTTPQNKLNVVGDVNITGSTEFESGLTYYGQPNINGSFKFEWNSTTNKLNLYRFENGVYILDAEFGSSITTDELILDGTNPQIFHTLNLSSIGFDEITLGNLIREPTGDLGTEVGDWFGDTLINTADKVTIQRKESPLFTGLVQPISNVTQNLTFLSYNTTTPSAAEGFFFDGAINFGQDYMLQENYTGIIYTKIFDYSQSITEPIWESSNFFDFTQGIGGELKLVENNTIYRDFFDTGVTLAANKTFLIQTTFSEEVQINGTIINGEFVPWLRSTAILFKNFEVAVYEFTDNNFNGSGNFTTTGNITLGEKLIFGLGEMIDNLVDGWLRITGNLNVTGNIIGNDMYGYAKMYNLTGVVIDLTSPGVFENVTGINNGSELNNVTYDGDHAFTINYPGIYEVSSSMSFVGASAAEYNFDIFVNEERQYIFSRRQIGTSNAEGSVSLGPYAINLNSGDYVTVRISDGITPVDPTIIGVQFGIRRIGG